LHDPNVSFADYQTWGFCMLSHYPYFSAVKQESWALAAKVLSVVSEGHTSKMPSNVLCFYCKKPGHVHRIFSSGSKLWGWLPQLQHSQCPVANTRRKYVLTLVPDFHNALSTVWHLNCLKLKCKLVLFTP
jgi:hypothetical protein